MAEELLEFKNTIEDPDGRSHRAVVLAERRKDSRWIGRIRFTSIDDGAVLETDRETTQPNRDALMYWATGLTYFYLQGALERARRRGEHPPGSDTSGATASVRAPTPAVGVPRLEIRARDSAIVEKVLGAREPRPGTARQVLDAGVIVYEGIGGSDGASQLFSLQFGSRNAGAILANWLWSRLHGSGVKVRVEGRAVELNHEAFHRALLP
jgi:hypothetical protein